MDKEPDKMQRKLLLEGLLSSPGFKEFEYELNELVLGVGSECDNSARNPMSGDALNFMNGKKLGLQYVVDLMRGFREELEEIAEER